MLRLGGLHETRCLAGVWSFGLRGFEGDPMDSLKMKLSRMSLGERGFAWEEGGNLKKRILLALLRQSRSAKVEVPKLKCQS